MKSQKGSISLFVLLSMLFFSIILVGIYVSNSNKVITQKETSDRIKEIYEKDVDNIDGIYESILEKNS